MKKLTAIFLMFVIFNNISIYCQDAYNNVIPPPPDAASLAKYADFPVNLYNGIPQIDIPLWTIEMDGVKVPISLSYHASGITVAEVASWVGLGWTLNCGGVITRSVRGLPDDQANGFLRSTYSANTVPVCPNTLGTNKQAYDYYRGSVDGYNDIEPDMFYFNFCDRSGKFVLDKNFNVHLIPYQKLQFSPMDIGLFPWVITTEDGTIFTFDEIEATNNVTTTYTVPTSFSSNNYNTSWYLKEIKSASGKNKINFEYTPFTESYNMPVSETKYQFASIPDPGNCRPKQNSTSSSSNTIYSKRISKITFPSGSIEFIPGSYRYDLQGSQVLDEIIIKDNNGNPIKMFKFSYNYFNYNGTTEFSALNPANASTSTDNAKRLALKSVQEYDGYGAQSNPPYVFTYENNQWLPDRINSLAQDHWGYYNGEINNNTLIPPHGSLYAGYIDGALREPNDIYAKAGSLTQITYPTGGYTSFVYESNETESQLAPNNFEKFESSILVGQCHVDFLSNTNPATSATFTINDEVNNNAMVKISFTGAWPPKKLDGGCSQSNINIFDPLNPDTYIYFKIYNITDPSNPVEISFGSAVIGYSTQDNIIYKLLPNGTYQLKALFGGVTELTQDDGNTQGFYKFEVSGVASKKGTKKVGGLRIKEKSDYDPISKQTITQTYSYKDNNLSTGQINYVPNYKSSLDEYYVCTETAGEGTIIEVPMETKYDIYTSFSNVPLTTMQGGTVGYDKITVYYGKDINTGLVGQNGKSEYYYYYTPDIYTIPVEANYMSGTYCYYNYDDYTPYSLTPLYPFAPAISFDWARGRLIHKIDYQNKNGVYLAVKEVINTYKDDYLGKYSPTGFTVHSPYQGIYPVGAYPCDPTNDLLVAKVGINAAHFFSSNMIDYYDLFIQFYYIPSRFYELTKTEEYTYDSNGLNPVGNIQEFDYDNLNHMQVSRKTIAKSDGRQDVTQLLYPDDYTDITGFIGEMKTAHIINKPIETINYLMNSDGTGIQIHSGELNTFKQGQSTKIGLPDQCWKLRNSSPILLSDFQFSNQAGKGTLPSSGTKSSFSLATKDSHYPQIADFSFDFDDFSNITYVQKHNDNPTSYFWGYNNTLPVIKVENIDNSTLSAKVTQALPLPYTTLDALLNSISSLPNADWTTFNANLRNLTGAHITTYTYKPFVGMTSQTDPGGVITFYEYDNFNRLKVIKDKDGNILKTYDYHYKQ